MAHQINARALEVNKPLAQNCVEAHGVAGQLVTTSGLQSPVSSTAQCASAAHSASALHGFAHTPLLQLSPSGHFKRDEHGVAVGTASS